MAGTFSAAGCTEQSATPSQRAALKDYGEFPKNYEALARRFLNTTVADPSNAAYDVARPVRASLRVGSVLHPQESNCWLIRSTVTERGEPGTPVARAASYDIYVKFGVIQKTEKTPSVIE